MKQATTSNTPDKEIDKILNLTTNFAMGFFLLDEVYPSFGSGIFGHSGSFFNIRLHSFLIDFSNFRTWR